MLRICSWSLLASHYFPRTRFEDAWHRFEMFWASDSRKESLSAHKMQEESSLRGIYKIIRNKVAQRCICFINWFHTHTKSSSAAHELLTILYGIDSWHFWAGGFQSADSTVWHRKGLIKALSLPTFIHIHHEDPAKLKATKDHSHDLYVNLGLRKTTMPSEKLDTVALTSPLFVLYMLLMSANWFSEVIMEKDGESISSDRLTLCKMPKF